MTDRENQHRQAMDRAAADIAAEVQTDLQAWAARWPVFNPVRFPALALTTAMHLPELSRPARSLAALVSLWIIAFDEIVDEDRLTGSQLADLTATCRALVIQPQAMDVVWPDPLCAALQEIVREITRRPTFAAFASTWQAAFTDMLDAIVEHRRLGTRKVDAAATADSSPVTLSFDAVLALTTRSVGVGFYLITSWILYEDPALILRLDALLRRAEACAQAIRLANDLQTRGRDAEEGNVNTLSALEWELATALPDLLVEDRHAQALSMLQERLVATVARALTEPHPSAAIPQVERDMDRLVTFVTRLYAQYDYHTYRAASASLRP